MSTSLKSISLDIEQLEEAASMLKALAHPMRIAIVGLLSNNKRLSVTDIYSNLKIEQAAASHHLILLKSKKILKSQREGKKIMYYINEPILKDIYSCITKC